jgi:prepilin-type N-terminal cleavage/methylation domain-containing protein
MNDRSRNNAFTLVEMLIGLAIIGLIVSMVYGSYAATTRALDIYGSRMTCSDRAHLVLRLMAHQLRCAYAPPLAAPATGSSTPMGRGNQQTGALAARGISTASTVLFQGNPQEAGGEILRFLTTGGLSQGPDKPGGLSRVSYRYETQNGVLSLCCEPSAGPADHRRDSPVWRPVLRGVTGVDLEFYDGQRWQSTWNSRETARLPQAVRIILTLVDESGRTHRYETAAPIACRSSAPRQLRGGRAGQL